MTNSYEDIGTRKIDQGVSKSIGDYFEGERAESLSKARKIVLDKCPELGDEIHEGELKSTLGEIKETGYPVKSYDQMNARCAWAYLMGLKKEIIEKTKDSNCR